MSSNLASPAGAVSPDEKNEQAMIIHPADRDVVKWAVDQGFVYEYTREYGLPEPSLRIRLGLSSAFFLAGQLIHWRADVDAGYLDQLMAELTWLFGWCAIAKAYPQQEVFISPAERAALRFPPSKSA